MINNLDVDNFLEEITGNDGVVVNATPTNNQVEEVGYTEIVEVQETQTEVEDVFKEIEDDNNPIKQKYNLNPNNYMPDQVGVRQASAEWFDKMRQTSITLAGLGGIGSYTAFLLGRLNPYRIVCYDPDTIDASNLTGQMFYRSWVGTKKARAVDVLLDQFCNYQADVFDTRLYEFTDVNPILITGFDNMSARKTAYQAWLRKIASMPEDKRHTALYIDGRLAAENWQIFCIRGDDTYSMERYKDNHLFDDDQAEEPICSYKQTSFCASMIASYMVNLLVNHICNLDLPMRSMPFYTRYEASTMFLKTED